jgi:hypothetical protein
MKIAELYNKIRVLKLPWIEDPKTKEPSVSLTLTILFGALVIISWAIDKAPGPITEAFWGSAALYFGRKITVAVSSGKVNADIEDESNK